MGTDRDAIEQLLRASKPGTRHVFLHYLYLPSKAAALEVARELRAVGFTTLERLGADGSNWLVLARHEIVPDEAKIASARLAMEDMVGRRNGEYDGWEVELPQ